MALDKLTKVDGGGISTTSDYRVGIITATKFVGPIEGTITSTDANFSGNVTIGGTLTYEDVTNIDSVGIITARKGIVSSGVITATAFHGDGSNLTGIDATALKDPAGNVKIQAQASGAVHSGISTFQDLDVDGHTNLDNVSIAGVTTFASNVFLGDDDNLYLGASNDLRIYHAAGAASHINAVGLVNIDGTTGVRLEYNNANRVHCTSTGVTIGGDLDVDAHTNLDNVSVAGVTTFSDHINLPENKQIKFGGSNEFNIQHNTNENYIQSNSGHIYIRANVDDDEGDNIIIQAMSGEDSIKAIHDGAVELYWNGNKKFETGDTVNINSNHFEITSGQQLRFDNSNNDRSSEILNTGSSGNSTLAFKTNGGTRWTIDSSGHILPGTAGAEIGSTSSEIGDVFVADDKKVYFGNDQDFQIYHHSGGNSYIKETGGGALVINADDFYLQNVATTTFLRTHSSGAIDLTHSGNTKLSTSSTGVTVTGEVAASQDYPDIQPILDVNFAASRTLDQRFTFQRVGPASFVNEFGKVVLVGENVPRFDHDLTTRESLGILIEDERTNLFPYGTTPGDLWSSSKSGTFEENTTETTAPDGTFTATKWTFTNTDPYLYHAQTLSANTSYTVTMYVKAGTNMAGDYVQIRIGAAPYSPNGDDITVPTDGTWKRISYTKTVGGSNETSASVGFEPQVKPSGNPASGDVIYIWGAQLEAGGYATSFIPTWGSSTTRGADLLRIMDDEFKDIFGDEFKEFTIVADYDNSDTVDGTTQSLIDFWGESAGYTDRIEIFKDGDSPYHIETRSFGNNNALFANGTATASSKAATQRFATSWTVDYDYATSGNAGRRWAFSFSGEAVDVINDNTGTDIPALTRLGLGNTPTRLDLSPGKIHFKRFTFYPKAVSDQQLINLSTP